MRIRTAAASDLDAVTLYRILRLRAEVFVVEQRCPYQDLDGRDLEPDALHLWAEDDGEVVACTRLLRDPGGGSRIGRVATALGARGRRVAARLVDRALEGAPRPVVLHAQAHLEEWYEAFGFRRSGDVFDEDGIPHVPMRLDQSSG